MTTRRANRQLAILARVDRIAFWNAAILEGRVIREGQGDRFHLCHTAQDATDRLAELIADGAEANIVTSTTGNAYKL